MRTPSPLEHFHYESIRRKAVDDVLASASTRLKQAEERQRSLKMSQAIHGERFVSPLQIERLEHELAEAKKEFLTAQAAAEAHKPKPYEERIADMERQLNPSPAPAKKRRKA